MSSPDPVAMAVLDLLCEQFPKAFVRYEARRRPLKIGIHLDLMGVLDGAVSAAELKRALRIYTNNKVYRSKLRAGAQRFDLAGQAAGIVSAEHASRNQLQRIRRPRGGNGCKGYASKGMPLMSP
jgi:ProP effector